MPASPVLTVRSVSKRFDLHQALRDVSVDLRAAEVHAVIGENGAGKSTLMNIISGKLAPDAGELLWNGTRVWFASPVDALRAGVAMVPQELTLCPDLSVAENIMLGAHRTGSIGIDWRATHDIARTHLAVLDDTMDPRSRIRTLSTARQQFVQIARATAADAKVLIFDEPTASLTEREAGKLSAFIRSFRDHGGAIFYISHRLDEVLSLADRITVLRDGVVVCELDPATATKEDMVRQMAGRPVPPRPTHSARQTQQGRHPALRVTGLTRPGEFRNVSFDLRKGEILGVSGLVGSGRTEVAKCIFGVTRPERGRIEVDGRTVRHRCPADAIRNGIVYLPEERKKEGIFALLSVKENLAAAVLHRFRGPLGIRWASVGTAAREFAQRLNIRAASLDAPIASLSGGNQQKVILARWLLTDCKILVLDEPTRGIDVGAKAEIQAVLRGLTELGHSIIYISSELQELLEVSDRILVMHEGTTKGTLETQAATQEQLLGTAMS